MLLFNFNNFLFWHSIYILDFSFYRVAECFYQISWYSRIMFLDLKSVNITKTGHLSFSSCLNCVKSLILMIHFQSSLVNLLTSCSSSSVSISSYSISISVPMTSYFLFEASSSCSTGQSSKGFIELDVTSVLILISFPFSLNITFSFSWISSLGRCFSNKAFILCFSSSLNVLSIL